jgi:hypothetical protein
LTPVGVLADQHGILAALVACAAEEFRPLDGNGPQNRDIPIISTLTDIPPRERPKPRRARETDSPGQRVKLV